MIGHPSAPHGAAMSLLNTRMRTGEWGIDTLEIKRSNVPKEGGVCLESIRCRASAHLSLDEAKEGAMDGPGADVTTAWQW